MQVVWAKSYLLGCSRVQCPVIRQLDNTYFDNGFFTVCYYGPTYVLSVSRLPLCTLTLHRLHLLLICHYAKYISILNRPMHCIRGVWGPAPADKRFGAF